MPIASIRLSSKEKIVMREIKPGPSRCNQSKAYRSKWERCSRNLRGVVPNLDMVIQATDVLLVIDMQNDFCPGGALAITGADAIVPIVNLLAAKFAHVLLTQDWHPPRHISFASTHPRAEPYSAIDAPYGRQTLWPDHCVQGTFGADFPALLSVPHAELILRKGFRTGIDSYSAFLENDHLTPTGLGGYLRERGLKRLFLCGLAYDFCVRHSAIDGTALDFECLVIEDACRAVDLPGSVVAADQAFAEAGVRRVGSADVLAS
jgi:nicotinamidase/pyrazinamidase